LEGIPVKEFNFIKEDSSDNSRVSFVISRKNLHSWNKKAIKLNKLFDDKISIDDTLGAVSLIGEGFSRDNKIITDTISVLGSKKIKLYGLTTTSFRLSVLISKKDIESAVSLLHDYWIPSAGKNQ
jgi:aspartokinase